MTQEDRSVTHILQPNAINQTACVPPRDAIFKSIKPHVRAHTQRPSLWVFLMDFFSSIRYYAGAFLLEIGLGVCDIAVHHRQAEERGGGEDETKTRCFHLICGLTREQYMKWKWTEVKLLL